MTLRAVLSVLQFRTLQARLILPLCVIGCWAYLYAPEPIWLGREVELGLHLQSFAAIVVGPVLAAAGAWDISRLQRTSSAAYATASRSVASELSARIVVGSAWSAVILMTAWLAAWVRNFGLVGSGQAPWSLLGLSLSLCLVEIAAGTILGSRMPPIPAAATTLAVLAVLVFWQTREQLWIGGRRYFPMVSEHWGPWTVPSPWRLALAAAWCVALAGTAVCGVALLGRRRGHPSILLAWAAAATALAVGLSALTLTPAGSLLAEANSPVNRSCRSGPGFEVCLWTGDSLQMDAVFNGVGSARSALAGVTPQPTWYGEPGLSTPGSASTQEFYFPRVPRDDTHVASVLVDKAVPHPPEGCAQLLNVPSLGDYPLHVLVAEVLQRRLGVAGDTNEPVAQRAESILRTTRAGQDRWLRAAFAALQSCSDAPAVP